MKPNNRTNGAANGSADRMKHYIELPEEFPEVHDGLKALRKFVEDGLEFWLESIAEGEKVLTIRDGPSTVLAAGGLALTSGFSTQVLEGQPPLPCLGIAMVRYRGDFRARMKDWIKERQANN